MAFSLILANPQLKRKIASMTDGDGTETSAEDIVLGIEFAALTQEQVVDEFCELVGKDLAAAALRYSEFAAKLETVTHHGNAQIRSLVGGPLPEHRAGLVDVMADQYPVANDEIKEKILQLALEPLHRDNSFYVQMSVARMSGPELVGDIIRRFPLYFPGADYYEQDLLSGDNLQSPSTMQAWLDRLGRSPFAALGLAMQRDHAADVSIVLDTNRELFEGAAHIIAAWHDAVASRKMKKDPTQDRDVLLARYRSSFVDDFASMIEYQNAEANWLPV